MALVEDRRMASAEAGFLAQVMAQDCSMNDSRPMGEVVVVGATAFVAGLVETRRGSVYWYVLYLCLSFRHDRDRGSGYPPSLFFVNSWSCVAVVELLSLCIW